MAFKVVQSVGLWWLHVWVVLALSLLMYEREADVVFELRDGEVQLVLRLQLFEQVLREGSDNGLLIVVYHVLEELVDELNFEVCEIKACVVVAVEVVRQVQHQLVALRLIGRRDELVNPPIADVLHLRMASYEAVKLKLLQVGCVQVSDALALVGDEHALLRAERLGAVDDANVAIVVCRITVLLNVQVDLEVLNRLSLFGHIACVDARYKKAPVLVSARVCSVLRAHLRRLGLQGRSVLVVGILRV